MKYEAVQGTQRRGGGGGGGGSGGEETRAGRVLFGAGGQELGREVGYKRQLSLKKKERKLLPNTVEQEEGLGAHKSLPLERKRRAGLVIVQRYLLLPV